MKNRLFLTMETLKRCVYDNNDGYNLLNCGRRGLMVFRYPICPIHTSHVSDYNGRNPYRLINPKIIPFYTNFE